jgi:hypothetical protein
MVDFRLVHDITVEMCTGFLLLGCVAVLVKVIADGWVKYFGKRSARLTDLAIKASKFAEPASFFGLLGGVLVTFVSMVTGSLAWPADQLTSSTTAHNKILTTITTQTVFIGAVLIRGKFHDDVWKTKSTKSLYVIMVIAGLTLLTVQNSVAGHLAGKGSVLDDFFHSVGVNTQAMWLFPDWASMLIIVVFPIMAILAVLLIRRRSRTARPRATPG